MEAIRGFLQRWSVTKFLWDYLLSHPSIIVAVVFLGVTTWGYIDSRKPRGDKGDIITSGEGRLDKLGLVEKAIMDAQRIISKGKDVPVYITKDNGLTNIFATELKDILMKLQNEKVLQLTMFPDWLLPDTDKFTREKHRESIRAIMDPSRNHFTVRLLKDLSNPDMEGSQT